MNNYFKSWNEGKTRTRNSISRFKMDRIEKEESKVRNARNAKYLAYLTDLHKRKQAEKREG